MRISVILPAKNEAEGLQRTLPALRAQLPDAEVIVVDDGSTDASAAAVDTGDGWISVLTCAPENPYAARN